MCILYPYFSENMQTYFQHFGCAPKEVGGSSKHSSDWKLQLWTQNSNGWKLEPTSSAICKVLFNSTPRLLIITGSNERPVLSVTTLPSCVVINDETISSRIDHLSRSTSTKSRRPWWINATFTRPKRGETKLIPLTQQMKTGIGSRWKKS